MPVLLRNAYRRAVGSKFLNKIQFIYFTVVIAAVVLLTLLLSNNVGGLLTEQAKSYNMQLLMTIDRYFEGQCRNAKDIHQQILENADFYGSVVTLLGSRKGSDTADVIGASAAVQAQMRSKLNTYSDIRHIYLYDLAGQYSPFYITADEPKESTYSRQFLAIARDKPAQARGGERLFLSPSISAGKSHYFCMYDYIRDRDDLSSVRGAILFDYDVQSVSDAYSLFARYLKGSLLILNGEGAVVYDSSGQYYGRDFPLFRLVSQAGSREWIPYGGGYVNVMRNGTFGFYTVGVVPYAELYRDIGRTKRDIYIIALCCMAGILAVTFFGTRLLSRRMAVIVSSIRRIQKGDFTTRIDVRANDELGEISRNLNDMCGRIGDYIEREYVNELHLKDADLRQKEAELRQNEAVLSQRTAELVALQTQIDPHFLYNSLEVIRMNALSGGESEAAKMIEALSAMFRSGVKSGMVVTVREEIDFCKSYLELFNIRFAGNLKCDFDISDDIGDYGIIRHLLQPIIENAVVHGLDLNREGNTMAITGRRFGGDIRITVKDNGKGMAAEELVAVRRQLSGPTVEAGSHLGVANVNSRIRLLYGEGYGLTIENAPGGGVRVNITVSAETKEGLLRHVQRIDCR